MASRKWEILKDLRQRKVDHTLALMLDTEKKKNDAVDSLNQILNYIKEYRKQIKADENAIVSATELARSHRFLQQLIQTSVQQEGLCIQLAYQLKQDQSELMRLRSDLKAIEKLDEKERQSQQKSIVTREARALDELARSQFLGKLHPHG